MADQTLSAFSEADLEVSEVVGDEVDSTEDTTDFGDSKAEMRASIDKYITTLNMVNKLSTFFARGGGKPMTLPNGSILDAKEMKSLYENLERVSRSLLMAKLTRKRESRKTDGSRATVGFKRPAYFTDKIINWLNDPRTTFTPQNCPGLNPGESLQSKLVILSKEQVRLVGEDGSTVDLPLGGVSTAGILSANMSLYIDTHDLKGVPDPGRLDKDGKPVIDRRYWRPDQNILDHFGDIINGPVREAIEAGNIRGRAKALALTKKDKEKNKDAKPRHFFEASVNAIPTGMSMKIFAACRDQARTTDPISAQVLANPAIADLLTQNQLLVSNAVDHNKIKNKK